MTRWLWFRAWRRLSPRLKLRLWALRPRIALQAVAMFTTSQVAARGYADDAAMGSATPKAAQNTDWTQNVDENFRIRIEMQETGGASGSFVPRLQYNLNGAGFVNVTDVSTVVRSSASPNVADGAATANLLTVGTGTFAAGAFDEVDGLTGTHAVGASGHTEAEWCVQILSADVVDTDTIVLRAIGKTNATTVFDAYTYAGPTVTVSEAAGGQTVDGVVLTITPELPAGALSHTLTGIVLTVPPSLPTGTVVKPVLDQVGFRARNDDGNETTATWKVAENTDWSQAVDENFRVRFVVDETGGGDPATHVYAIQYNLNAAGWVDVSGTSIVIRSSASPNLADSTPTTRQLSSGTGTFVAGGFDEGNGESGPWDLAAGDLTEVEYCVQIRSADVVNNDTIDLRVMVNPATPLDAYTQVPTITVSEAGGGQQIDGVVLTVTPTLPAGSLSHSLTGVVLTVAPSLPTGTLLHSLAGAVLTVTPSLPAGVLTHSITGVALTVTPSFPAGALAHSITGAVLTATPDLPAGVVSAAGGPQTVTGIVLTVTPTLPVGALVHTLTGVVLTATPSFPAGEVTVPGAQTVTGVVLTVTPVLPVGTVAVSSVLGIALTVTPVLPVGTVTTEAIGVPVKGPTRASPLGGASQAVLIGSGSNSLEEV